MLVTQVAPPHLLAWTWGEQLYRFELSAHGTGCDLVFTHVFTPAFGLGWQHAAGWDAYFNRLDTLLAGGFLSEKDAHVGMSAAQARFRQAVAPGGIPDGGETG